MRSAAKVFFSIVIAFVACFIGWFIYEVATDPMNDLYKDQTEYPLTLVDEGDDAEYMLVIPPLQSGSGVYRVTTDTQAIKANKETFTVENLGALYGTTPDGLICLYKDGEYLSATPADGTLTKRITYGTLQFEQVNKLQHDVLCGYVVVDSSENHTTLRSPDENAYYYRYAHGTDTESPDAKIIYMGSDKDLNNLPAPSAVNENILEFIQHYTNYAGDQTRHRYFRRSDGASTEGYSNVKAISDTVIVYAAYINNGQASKIVVRDVFDESALRIAIADDTFPGKRDDQFLLAAEFTEDGALRAVYVGDDGEEHEGIFPVY